MLLQNLLFLLFKFSESLESRHCWIAIVSHFQEYSNPNKSFAQSNRIFSTSLRTCNHYLASNKILFCTGSILKCKSADRILDIYTCLIYDESRINRPVKRHGCSVVRIEKWTTRGPNVSWNCYTGIRAKLVRASWDVVKDLPRLRREDKTKDTQKYNRFDKWKKPIEYRSPVLLPRWNGESLYSIALSRPSRIDPLLSLH